MIDKCSQCGICCRLFLVNLTEVEYLSGKYLTQFEEFGLIEDFDKASACGSNVLKQKGGGCCIYLKKKICSIHKTRPQVCREFFCTSKLKKFKQMIKQIEKKKASLRPTCSTRQMLLQSNCQFIDSKNNLTRFLK